MAHVLVIDDEAAIRSFVRLALEKAGHRVSEAADGDEGLRAFRADPADLVLCDIFMPEKDGLETIQILRRASPGVPVVAIGGGNYRGTDFLAVARKLGATAALYKPFAAAA